MKRFVSGLTIFAMLCSMAGCPASNGSPSVNPTGNDAVEVFGDFYDEEGICYLSDVPIAPVGERYWAPGGMIISSSGNRFEGATIKWSVWNGTMYEDIVAEIGPDGTLKFPQGKVAALAAAVFLVGIGESIFLTEAAGGAIVLAHLAVGGAGLMVISAGAIALLLDGSSEPNNSHWGVGIPMGPWVRWCRVIVRTSSGDVNFQIEGVLAKGVTVPNVVGKTQTNAESILIFSSLVVGNVGKVYSATIPAGRVISQNPVAGTSVSIGSAVNLVVSKGQAPPPPVVIVPCIVAMVESSARSTVTGAGLVPSKTGEEYHATIPVGSVTRQNPVAGTSVNSGSTVGYYVSKGQTPPPPPPVVIVPCIVAMVESSARSTVTGAGLVPSKTGEEYHATIPVGSVTRQNPVAGNSVDAGSTVQYWVSKGQTPPPPPPPPVVPNVTGIHWSSAVAVLWAAPYHLPFTSEWASSSMVAAGIVISQSPAAGSSVAGVTSVHLVVSSGPA